MAITNITSAAPTIAATTKAAPPAKAAEKPAQLKAFDRDGLTMTKGTGKVVTLSMIGTFAAVGATLGKIGGGGAGGAVVGTLVGGLVGGAGALNVVALSRKDSRPMTLAFTGGCAVGGALLMGSKGGLGGLIGGAAVGLALSTVLHATVVGHVWGE
jgi:hypothetical protein